MLILITLFEFVTKGLVWRLCAAIGVMTKADTSGANIGPPEDKLYAVEPVGVLIITPSEEYLSTKNH